MTIDKIISNELSEIENEMARIEKKYPDHIEPLRRAYELGYLYSRLVTIRNLESKLNDSK